MINDPRAQSASNHFGTDTDPPPPPLSDMIGMTASNIGYALERLNHIEDRLFGVVPREAYTDKVIESGQLGASDFARKAADLVTILVNRLDLIAGKV